jgi:hypothetical protein
MDAITGESDVLEIRTNRHSLIDLSGTALAPTFADNGETVAIYNGPTGAGQPYDQDVLVPHIETFCFDPAVDPVPPDGLPLSQVMNRAFQNTRVYSDNLSQAVPNENGFFFNTAAFNTDKTTFGDSLTAQWPVTDMTHTEQPGYNYTPCGDSFCRFEYTSMQASDPQSWNRTCTPFAFKGGIDYSYCYNPGVDPNPPEATVQCGDYWQKPVALTPDWQFYKIPFSDLLQQGWAKRFYQFDISSLTDIRIEWNQGWADFWISDVRFYRTKQQ